jgi:PAS domain S-box-containing protein
MPKRPKSDKRTGKHVETDRLEAIIEGSRDALWTWTPEGIIVRWNAEAQRLFGYSAKEVTGRSLLLLVPPEQHAQAQEVITKVSQGQWYEQYETVRVRKDGSKVDVELTVSPIVNQHGQVVECLSSCRDISDRKQLQSMLAGRMNELTTLIRFTEQLQTAEKLEDIYCAALDAIRDALGCDTASILLFDSAKVMRFVAWRGLSDEYRRTVDGHSPWTADCESPELIYINDIDSSDQSTSLKAVIRNENIRALAFIPLVSKAKLIGNFMTYYRRPHTFSVEEAKLANTVAQQLAIAIDRQVTHERLRESEVRFRLMSANACISTTCCAASGVSKKRRSRHLIGSRQCILTMLPRSEKACWEHWQLEPALRSKAAIAMHSAGIVLFRQTRVHAFPLRVNC